MVLDSDILRTLVNETELAEQTDEACVLQFAHQLALEAIDSAGYGNQTGQSSILDNNTRNSLLCFIQLCE